MTKRGDENEMSKNLKIILYITSAYCYKFSFIVGESPTDSSAKGATDVLASYVFGLYDAIGPSKSTYQKKEKIWFGITAKLCTVLVLLVIDLYNWSLASNSWFFD